MKVLVPLSRMPRARTLAHPLPLGCVALLVINDHVLKGRSIVPAVVTGKLSDFAGLFFFPVLLVTVARASKLRWVTPPRAALATMLAFAAVKLATPVNALYAALLGPAVMDPSDLLALPCALAAALWMREAPTPSRGLGHGDRLAVLVAAVASSATSALHYPPCKTPVDPPDLTSTLEQTCLTSPGFRLRRQGTQVTGSVVLGTRGGPCSLALSWPTLEVRASAELRVRTRGDMPTPPPPMVEQGTVTVQVSFVLPADVGNGCEGLIPSFGYQGRRLVFPVVSCEVGP